MACGTGWLAAQGGIALGAETHSVKSTPDVTIYAGEYPGWPWITAARDGELFCVWREGTRHDFCPQGRLMLASSPDRGHSWSPARVFLDEAGVDDRNVAIVELPSRALLVVYNTYTADRTSLAMWTRSTDRGQTWTPPHSIGTPNTRTKAAPVVLADGTLVLPYYIAPGSGALAAVSLDSGDTWQTVRVPDTDGFIGDEWDLIEVEPGRLIGIIRNSHPESDGAFWVSESRDGGRTWSTPRRSNAQSRRHTSPPQLTHHAGKPLLVYSDRRMVSVSMARTTDPSLLRWDTDRQIPCYRYNSDESPITDGSYPVSVAVGDTRRLVVDYEIREQSRIISGYFVDVPAGW